MSIAKGAIGKWAIGKTPVDGPPPSGITISCNVGNATAAGVSFFSPIVVSCTVGNATASGISAWAPTQIILTGSLRQFNGVSSVVRATIDATSLSDISITPSDGGAGGVFVPASPVISAGQSFVEFYYTAATPGVLTLSTTNDSGLTDDSVSYKADSYNYYLSAIGSDANNGATTGAAWQTWAAAVAWGIVRGATYNFRGGDTFTQAININDGVDGQLAPDLITLTSYGTGKGIIHNSGAAVNPVTITNCGGVAVNNIEITGAGSTNGTTSQHLVNIIRDAGADLYNIAVEYCTIHNGKRGVSTGTAGSTGTKIHGLVIEHNNIYGLWDRGLNITANYNTPSVDYSWCTGLKIRYNHVHHLDDASSTATLTGIVWGYCDDSEVSYNLINDIGGVSIVCAGGMFCWGNTRAPWIHHNEIYNMVRVTGGDCQGINLDSGTTLGVVENNYCHAVDGPGLVCYAYAAGAKPAFVGAWSNNTFRFNVIQDCGGADWAAFSVSGDAIHDIKCYNNTFVVGAGVRAAIAYANPSIPTTDTYGAFYNNIIYVHGSTKIIDFPSASGSAGSQAFGANVYYMADAGAVSIDWFGTNYNSVATWGQDATGLISDPLMAAPDAATIFNDPSLIHTLAGTKLLAASPARNSGIDLSDTPYSYTGISTDFSDAAFPSGAWARGSTDYLEVGTTISCNVGNATTAGAPATFPQSLSCNVGNATATGITAQVEIAGQIVIGCNAGTATTAGVSANISSAFVLTCNAGTATTLGTTAYFPQSLQCNPGNAIASVSTRPLPSPGRRRLYATLEMRMQWACVAILAAGLLRLQTP